MATETSELIVKFVTQGVGDVGQASAAVKKLSADTEDAGKRVDAMGKSLSGAGKSSKEAGSDFAALGEKIESGLMNPLGSVAGFARSAATALGPVGIVAGVAAVTVGLLAKTAHELIAPFGAAAEQSINFADRLGISVGRAEQLQAAMRIAGVNAGALESAVRVLGTALEDPAGAGLKTLAALRGLSVASHELSGEQRELGPVLLDVLQKLSMISSDSERVAVAQKVLGRAGAVELIPFIKNLESLDGLIKNLGVGTNPELTQRLADYDDKVGALEEKFSILKRTLLAPLVTAGNSFLDFLITGGVKDRTVAPRENLENKFKAPEKPLLGIRIQSPELKIEQDYLKGTPRGVQRQIQELQSELSKEESAIFGIGASSVVKASAVIRAKQLSAEIDALQASLQNLGKTAKEVGGFTLGAFESIAPGSTQGPVGLIRMIQEAQAAQAKINEDAQKALAKINEDAKKAQDALADNAPDIGPGVALEGPSDKNLRESLDITGRVYKQLDDFKIRMISLGENEYDNAVRIRDVKLAAARDEVETQQAQLDFQVRVAEIEKQRIEKYQEQARGVYRSLRQGGTSGLGALIRGQADQIGEQLFVNVAGKTFKDFGGALGKVGGASGLPDWLLKGTLLDPQNDQKLALNTNTAATDRNSAALERTAAALTSGGGGGFNLSLPGGGGGFAVGAMADLPLLGLNGGKYGGSTVKGRDWGKIAGYGAAIAGGAFGVASGAREGGVGGGLTAASAGLGAAGSIMMLAGATGPAAPILAGIGIGLAVIKAFIPDAAKTFYSEQEKLIASRQFTAPDAMSRGLDFATGGTPIEANFRGQSRVIVNHVITMNVNAIDAQSIMDRKDDLADAVAAATAGGSIPMTSAINQTVFGAGG